MNAGAALIARNVQLSFICQKQYELGKGMVFNLSARKGDTCFRVMSRGNPQETIGGPAA